MKRCSKVIDCTQQLQVRENVMGFEKALRAVEVIKDQIQYKSQSLLNLARGYFSVYLKIAFIGSYEPMTSPNAMNTIKTKNVKLLKLWAII